MNDDKKKAEETESKKPAARPVRKISKSDLAKTSGDLPRSLVGCCTQDCCAE